ncbi:MAG: hypothetical protein DRP65_12090 [Planctomycetota bacterium]|nr:MAG: hypothetical protein DRP65_12090 [Planctomycetota bacterium]
MAKWLEYYNPKPLIERLNKVRSINENGQVQFRGFEESIVPARLDSMVQLTGKIPEDEKYSIVKEAVWRAAKKKITRDNLLKELCRLESEYLKAPKKKYVLLTSLSIGQSRHKLKNVQENRCRITFGRCLPLRFAKARKQAIDDFPFLSKGINFPRGYLLVRVSVSDKTIEGGAAKALASLNLIRGLLNLARNLRYGYTASLVGKRKPINKILLGSLHTLHKPNGEIAVDGVWHNGYSQEMPRLYNPSLGGEFVEVLEFAKNTRECLKKCRYRDCLVEAIVRYNSALDKDNWETSYIELWGVLEYLTNTLNDSYKTTIRRVSFIYEDQDGAKQTLSLLRDFRNKLVHRGTSTKTIEVFIFDLKRYVEQLLLFLIFNKFRFRSLEVAASFLDQSRDIDVIYRQIDVLKAAKNFVRTIPNKK